MRILLINNGFHGSYESNQYFFYRTREACFTLGWDVLIANTIEQAREIYEKENFDFSLCFSKYPFKDKGIPLYEQFRKPHFQWISDNPLKMIIDCESEWIHYIFIDYEFPLVCAPLKNPVCYYPLPFLSEESLAYQENTKKAVLFPGKIRSLSTIENEIRCLPEIQYVRCLSFIQEYTDLNFSFIQKLIAFERKFGKLENKEFRLLNEYFRVRKRIVAINKILDWDVYILGEDEGNFKDKTNIHFLEPISYRESEKLMNLFGVVLNVDSNYHCCITDRFIKSVFSSTPCLSNRNAILKDPEYTFSFTDCRTIDKYIESILNHRSVVLKKQQSLVSKYTYQHALLCMERVAKQGGAFDGYAL